MQEAFNQARLSLWQRQPDDFFQQPAVIDIDSSVVETEGECKQGADFSYKGDYGYHPLLITLSNTNEVLWLKNRPGNAHSARDFVEPTERAIGLCLDAGFEAVLLRGDTAFAAAKEFDGWTDRGTKFVFGYKCYDGMVQRAEGLDDAEYSKLVREADKAFDNDKKQKRAKQPRIKEQQVRERGYKNKRTKQEDVAVFDYSPGPCQRDYRVVALKKEIEHSKGGQVLFTDYKYLFYITNDPDLTAEEVIKHANKRCNQEKLIEQLKNGTRSLRAPLNTLNSNWAYMVFATLAWSLKAWMALVPKIWPRWGQRHRKQRDLWLKMSFRKFQQSVINIPVQIVSHARKRIHRFLAFKSQLPVLFRVLDGL